MSRRVEFQDELAQLFEMRTRWLRNALGGGPPGRIPKFSRETVNRAISRMQETATEALARSAAREALHLRAEPKISWQIGPGKGRTRELKKKEFLRWYKSAVRHRYCIYMYWADAICIYVGQSATGGGRVAAHFMEWWFSQASRIDVYPVRTSGYLPMLECLGIHWLRPKYNKIRAARRKWTRRCRICDLQRDIEVEVRYIFRMR